jgi:hypothetical protein
MKASPENGGPPVDRRGQHAEQDMADDVVVLGRHELDGIESGRAWSRAR